MTSQSALFTTAQVARMAAVSRRQLQWWDEQGLLSPAREGHCRLYRRRELFAVLLFRELKERGFSLPIVRKVWAEMQARGFEMPIPEEQRWLLTDGARVVLLAEGNTVLAFLEQRRSPAFVLVSLTQLAQRMKDQQELFARRGPGRCETSRASGVTPGWTQTEARRA